MNFKEAEVNNLMMCMLGITHPDKVVIDGREIKWSTYQAASEKAANDKRVKDLIEKLTLEYVDEIETYYKQLEARIRKELEEMYEK